MKIEIEYIDGFYVAEIRGRPVMKGKVLSKLLKRIAKFYQGQGQ